MVEILVKIGWFAWWKGQFWVGEGAILGSRKVVLGLVKGEFRARSFSCARLLYSCLHIYPLRERALFQGSLLRAKRRFTPRKVPLYSD